MDPKNILLNGGIAVTVIYEDGTSADIASANPLTVRQIKLRDYPLALQWFLGGDEKHLLALCCGVQPRHLDHVSPESFESLYTAMEAANAAGFFQYAARQQRRQMQSMASLPPAVLEKFLAKFTPTSSTPSPITQPPAG